MLSQPLLPLQSSYYFFWSFLALHTSYRWSSSSVEKTVENNRALEVRQLQKNKLLKYNSTPLSNFAKVVFLFCKHCIFQKISFTHIFTRKARMIFMRFPFCMKIVHKSRINEIKSFFCKYHANVSVRYSHEYCTIFNTNFMYHSHVFMQIVI